MASWRARPHRPAVTAVITISRSPFSSSVAYWRVKPYLDTAAITISRSPFSSSEALLRAKWFKGRRSTPNPSTRRKRFASSSCLKRRRAMQVASDKTWTWKRYKLFRVHSSLTQGHRAKNNTQPEKHVSRIKRCNGQQHRDKERHPWDRGYVGTRLRAISVTKGVAYHSIQLMV